MKAKGWRTAEDGKEVEAGVEVALEAKTSCFLSLKDGSRV